MRPWCCELNVLVPLLVIFLRTGVGVKIKWALRCTIEREFMQLLESSKWSRGVALPACITHVINLTKHTYHQVQAFWFSWHGFSFLVSEILHEIASHNLLVCAIWHKPIYNGIGTFIFSRFISVLIPCFPSILWHLVFVIIHRENTTSHQIQPFFMSNHTAHCTLHIFTLIIQQWGVIISVIAMCRVLL